MMIKTYAVVENDLVKNVIVLDINNSDWSPPPNSSIFDVEGLGVGPGWTRSNSEWVPPPPPVDESS